MILSLHFKTIIVQLQDYLKIDTLNGCTAYNPLLCNFVKYLCGDNF